MSQRVLTSQRGGFLRPAFIGIVAFILLWGFLGSPVSAQVPRSYAGIVVDAKTGNTLYSYAADSLRYPASVTKVMTLYILFQELEAGRLTLSSRLNVSSYAASAIPTKLYVRAGSTIKVEDAIKSLVTLSANDVARVIAENISGSERKFAERMTATARALGMSRTTYTNASGLPSTRQVTTVRDQARLGMAIFQHFPQYYHYFQLRSFTYAGKTYGSHNRLLGRNGVDGIKTGYTRASGFNLLTAARKNNRHVVVVGFGFSSGNARNAKVAELLNKYMGRARRGSYWAQASIPEVGITGSTNVFAVASSQPVTPMPRPPWRAVAQPAQTDNPVQADIQVAGINPDELPIPLVRPAPPSALRDDAIAQLEVAAIAPPTELIPSPAVQATAIAAGAINPSAPASVDVIGAWLSNNFRLGPRSSDEVLPNAPAMLIPPAPIGNVENQAIDLMTSGSIEEMPSATPVPSSPATNSLSGPAWVIQIGAPPSADGAELMLDSATQRISKLADFRSYIERFEKTGQTFFRARFAGFSNREEALAMCEQIREKEMSCLAVQS